MSKTIIHFNSREENIRIIEPIIENLKYSIGLGEDIVANIVAAVSEAVHNAIVHGNKADENKMVKFEMHTQKSCIKFKIEDEGTGFESNSVPDPTDPSNIENISGRGVYIIQALADKAEFESEKGLARLEFNI